ncbi:MULTISPECIES: copper chaperone PCu(A)C [unclassified Pseudoalteromonas]|uniref:copper chaperone PCu(A)C n=1 Tax=unclassified Pseudoalteromonas TaxID=194690 RepID=UPI000CF6CDD4|nr:MULTISPECIES: copper chaperone PCu(A)C [unclassified Pseudoalteromonas]
MLRIFNRALLAATALCACTFSYAQDGLMISEAKVRQFLPAASSSVGYFTLENNSERERTLKAVELESLGRVEIHTHEHSDGMMKMRKLDSLTIGANSRIVLQPGGLHLMLFSPQQALSVDQTLKMTLIFADGERVNGQARVFSLIEKEQKRDSGSEHQHHHN